MNAQLSDKEAELLLIEEIAAFTHDPLGHVLYVYPWGVTGTALEKEEGPRPWQREILESIGNKLHAGIERAQAVSEALDEIAGSEVIQEATASGHGIGKSALVSWIIKWGLDTFEDARGIVTANTDTQLRTKTWPEVGKWHQMSINRHWFTHTATALISTAKGHDKTWRVDAIPWSENNTEAFAGLHNAGKRVILIFDEASAIADKVWEVAEGALTDENTEIIWCAFGNPTRTTGRFRDCFGRLGHRWANRQIDSRTVPGTNKRQIQKWIDDYGEDSDFVRVRVRGMFPNASSMQFIESSIVAEAMRREPIAGLRDPLIMTVDVARGGADYFVIGYRRGMDAKSIPWHRIPGSEARDSMKMVAKVTDLATTTDPLLRPDAIIVDETGVGGPLVDRLRQILGDGAQVYGVNFASSSPDKTMANMRMYMYSKMRDALRGGLSILDDPHLEAELTAPEFHHDKINRLILESKDDMRDRVGFSPDMGDALALSYAYAIQPRATTAVSGHTGRAVTDYDPFTR